jgi:hypothetical protein
MTARQPRLTLAALLDQADAADQHARAGITRLAGEQTPPGLWPGPARHRRTDTRRRARHPGTRAPRAVPAPDLHHTRRRDLAGLAARPHPMPTLRAPRPGPHSRRAADGPMRRMPPTSTSDHPGAGALPPSNRPGTPDGHTSHRGDSPALPSMAHPSAGGHARTPPDPACPPASTAPMALDTRRNPVMKGGRSMSSPWFDKRGVPESGPSTPYPWHTSVDVRHDHGWPGVFRPLRHTVPDYPWWVMLGGRWARVLGLVGRWVAFAQCGAPCWADTNPAPGLHQCPACFPIEQRWPCWEDVEHLADERVTGNTQ